MADATYGVIGFVSSLFLNLLVNWIHVEDIGKAAVLGFAGAIGGIVAKHLIQFIKSKIKLLYNTIKNKNPK